MKTLYIGKKAGVKASRLSKRNSVLYLKPFPNLSPKLYLSHQQSTFLVPVPWSNIMILNASSLLSLQCNLNDDIEFPRRKRPNKTLMVFDLKYNF
jgi:hypothetical protein